MCGIFGIYKLNKNNSIINSKVETSLNAIKHRGPDNQAFQMINDNLCFGHVRLSIIDLNV